MWGTLGVMYKTEGGMSALYRGIIPTVAGVAPYVSLDVLTSLNQLLIESRSDSTSWSTSQLENI